MKKKNRKKVILSDTWEVIIFKENVTRGDACMEDNPTKIQILELIQKMKVFVLKDKKLSATNPSQDSISR